MKAKKTTTTIDLGGFRPGSYKAKIYRVLSDGKLHEVTELQKAARGCANIPARVRAMTVYGAAIKAVDGTYRLDLKREDARLRKLEKKAA